MGVKQLGETYKCDICGNIVRVIKVGGGTLVCCGQDMKQIEDSYKAPINLPDSSGE
ncbi:desulforedoxin [Dehalococcoides mccartyi]|jgi:superoxide reductase|uniref:Putative desulforedoxin n=1 Tax=Dehalococcoides mccartyi TaxID=61435 RepID=A0A328EMR5_9CHLR|nr:MULTISPECIES: desulfoferrodoxin FeS4 iron-binding domain-containing protein [Dehalococcoides]AGG07096.1 putative desulforedoxin [Dehalococcoides mccartyi DCMB5]KSV18205.1 desulforedoxin [Dehalococcoides mccartyi]RAL69932.1 putative desulforedoxin [Dehalococcoides mccartyi]RAL71111.1 putative desulforedoxin [Dehalococcoides mccartyi]BAS32577.1 Desulfoferrodoxin Dfx domain-containing protein [Dehalococcoides mccartyi IBARAKI]